MNRKNESKVKQHKNQGWTLLHHAACENDVALTKQIISTGGLDINTTCNSILWTPLHYAAEFCQNEVLELLLRAGASVSHRDWLGHTAKQILSHNYIDPTSRRMRLGFGHGSKAIPARACYALHMLHRRGVLLVKLLLFRLLRREHAQSKTKRILTAVMQWSASEEWWHLDYRFHFDKEAKS